jgi:hypothetical protein
MVNWSPEVKDAAMNVMRGYVRNAPLELAAKLPQILEQKHGQEMRLALEAVYRLRLILGGSDFMEFTQKVVWAAQLLIDMAAVYHESQEAPQVFRVRRAVEESPGGLSDVERIRLASNLRRIGEQVLKLHHHHKTRSRKTRSDTQASKFQMMQGTSTPVTGIEAIAWIGRHFSAGETIALNLERSAPPHLLGSRSVNLLLRDTDAAVALFDGLLSAFPEKETIEMNFDAWMAEVNSVWGLLSLHNQRQIEQNLIENAQLLAQVMQVVGQKGDERSLQNKGLSSGKQQPRTVIDVLQWLSGYLAQMHK